MARNARQNGTENGTENGTTTEPAPETTDPAAEADPTGLARYEARQGDRAAEVIRIALEGSLEAAGGFSAPDPEPWTCDASAAFPCSDCVNERHCTQAERDAHGLEHRRALGIPETVPTWTELLTELERVGADPVGVETIPDREGYIPGAAVVFARRRRAVVPEAPYTTWEWAPGAGLFGGHYDLTEAAGVVDFRRRADCYRDDDTTTDIQRRTRADWRRNA